MGLMTHRLISLKLMVGWLVNIFAVEVWNTFFISQIKDILENLQATRLLFLIAHCIRCQARLCRHHTLKYDVID